MQNQAIFELYTDNNKSNYSSNPKDILKTAKKLWKIEEVIEGATLGVL